MLSLPEGLPLGDEGDRALGPELSVDRGRDVVLLALVAAAEDTAQVQPVVGARAMEAYDKRIFLFGRI